MNLIELNRALRQLRLGGIAAVLETRLHQASRGSRFRSGLSAGDHCRSWPYRSDVSLWEMPLFVGRGLPWRRRERWRELQPPVSEGQSSHAALTQSGCQRRHKS